MSIHERETRSVGLLLIALALVAILTQCKSFSGIDPMEEDGWEKVKIVHVSDHNLVFVSYRDAERERSIASASVRMEAATPEPLYFLRKEGMQIRSEQVRMQFDCSKHAVRALRYTLYQNNNLKGTSITRDMGGTCPWTYGGAGPFDLGGFDAPTEREKEAWNMVTMTVCAHTALQSAEAR